MEASPIELTLSPDQQYASTVFTDFLLAPDAKYMVIQGDSGSGKSTLVKHLLDSMEARMKLYTILLGSKEGTTDFSIELTATTNKAAGVLAEVTGRPCGTIYSLLGLTPWQNYETGETEFKRGRNSQDIYNSLIVIDEASFINNDLFTDIDEMTHNCKILLVGDKYQLVPAKQTVPIMDTVELTCKHKVHLTQVMRHGGSIAQAGAGFKQAVKTGVFSSLMVNGVDIIHTTGPEFQALLDEEFTHPDYHEDKARVLAWMNDTVTMYNAHIRQIRGCSTQYGGGEVLSTNRPIVVKKQVIAHTDTNVHITRIGQEEVEAGVTGKLVTINNYNYQFFLPDDPIAARNHLKSVSQKKQWAEFFRLQGYWLDLRPAFASTIHKAQGSTYDTVYINLSDISRCRIASDVARMMYVAVTRSAKKVILYGKLSPQYCGE
jgi:nucleoside-triphosphatase THEP1